MTLISYLKYHKPAIAGYLLLIALFSAIFYLYKLPMEAVAYPATISAILIAIIFFFDFQREKARFKKLIRIAESPFESSGEEAELCLWEGERRLVSAMRRDFYREKELWDNRIRNTEFYYSMWVHQIKTPISAMDLIMERNMNEDNRKLSLELRKIERYVEMAMVLSRLKSSSSDYVFRDTDLLSIINSSIKGFSKEFIYKKLSVKADDISLNVVTDEKWLKFVIDQIISNSLKYTDRGGIEISTVGRILKIKDSGMGISSADLPRIFERGFTGYNGRESRHSSGLGLSIAKEICDNLGIDIDISSEEGVGTCVNLRFPKEKSSIKRD